MDTLINEWKIKKKIITEPQSLESKGLSLELQQIGDGVERVSRSRKGRQKFCPSCHLDAKTLHTATVSTEQQTHYAKTENTNLRPTLLATSKCHS